MQLLTNTTVEVRDGTFQVNGYVTADPDIVAHFAATSDDLVTELEGVLALGVRVKHVVAPAVDVEYIERRFGVLVRSYESLIREGREALASEVVDGLQAVIAPDGAFATSLQGITSELGCLIGRYFGEDSAAFVGTVVAAKVEQLLKAGHQEWDARIAEAQRQQQRLVSEAFDLTCPESALSRLMARIDGRDHESALLLTELIAKVSSATEMRRARDRSVWKGMDYQEEVLRLVGELAERRGDAFEAVGEVTGIKGKKGDGVISLAESFGQDSAPRIVVEVKNHATIRLPELLRELDEAMINRNAMAAIAVVHSVEAPSAGGSRLQRCGQGRVVCVVEPDGGDSLALDVAYAVAVSEAMKRCAAMNTCLDFGAVVGLVDKAAAQLQDLTKVERYLRAGRTSIEDAQEVVSNLRNALRATLGDLRAVLRANP